MFDSPAVYLPGALFLSVGLGALGLGLLRRARQRRRVAGRSPVTARVVDETMLGDTWAPVLRWTDPDGRQRTGVPASWSWNGVSRIGRDVVAYPDPDRPGWVETLELGGRGGALLVPLGLALAALGVLMLLVV